MHYARESHHHRIHISISKAACNDCLLSNVLGEPFFSDVIRFSIIFQVESVKESRNEYDFGFELCSKHWALFGLGFVRRNMPIAHAPAYVHLHQTNPIQLD